MVCSVEEGWSGCTRDLHCRVDRLRPVQIHEEAQRKAEAEAAAVIQEQQRAAQEAERLAAAAKQRALTVHQIQAQREAEARKKYGAPSCCLQSSGHRVLCLYKMLPCL